MSHTIQDARNDENGIHVVLVRLGTKAPIKHRFRLIVFRKCGHICSWNTMINSLHGVMMGGWCCDCSKNERVEPCHQCPKRDENSKCVIP